MAQNIPEVLPYWRRVRYEFEIEKVHVETFTYFHSSYGNPAHLCCKYEQGMQSATKMEMHQMTYLQYRSRHIEDYYFYCFGILRSGKWYANVQKANEICISNIYIFSKVGVETIIKKFETLNKDKILISILSLSILFPPYLLVLIATLLI